MAQVRSHTTLPAGTIEKKGLITDCDDINALPIYFAAFPGWLVLDLDNTLIEPEDIHRELGSDQWFYSFLNYASKVPLESDLNHVALVLTIYRAVQFFINLKLIQDESVEIIKKFQHSHKIIFATARDPHLMDITLQQLKRLGIELVSWEEAEKKIPFFKNGVLFCGDRPKAVCLKELLDFLHETPDILMVDDKRKHLETVQKQVVGYGGGFFGLLFRRLDEKVTKHNFVAAQEQLQKILPIMPAEAQAAAKKLKVM